MKHDLVDLLEKHDAMAIELRRVQQETAAAKLELVHYALDNHCVDALTVNIEKLKRYAY